MMTNVKRRHLSALVASGLLLMLALAYAWHKRPEKNDAFYLYGCSGGFNVEVEREGKTITAHAEVTLHTLKDGQSTASLSGSVVEKDASQKIIADLTLFRTIGFHNELSNKAQSIYTVVSELVNIGAPDTLDTNPALAAQVLSPLIVKPRATAYLRINYLNRDTLMVSDLFTPVFICTLNKP